ncbi:MAG TPA: hypothetical protein VJT85_05680 [Gemmatimonadaceae bacterium]|nr:hypothetical protein [Gemmatimonadaceae bacterium]
MSAATLSAGAIRVVLAGIPGLTAELVRRSVVGQSDVSIVAELRHAEDVTSFAQRQPLDVVVTVRTSMGVPTPCQQLLFGETAVPVIVIGPDGRLEIYNRRDLREAALDELLVEIRRVSLHAVAPPQH